ncbi:MAG: fibronectin-binding domain-containing protein, partial [Candidatus Eremiobacteraeota bacterium]|nr:fibronectin-binding domain-containing protein [Candidatus Eremiobacteraeota bacterium]
DVTFRVAHPDDLWFHAQGIPGAHVVLARDDRTPPPDEDIELAAALAAFHSKARTGGKVPVDYTLRKYVRKQQKAPPGLVWYTQPTTVLVRPASGPSS